MRSSIDIHTYLVERGVPHEFFRLERLARTREDVAAQLGIDPGSFAVATVMTGDRTVALAVTSLGSALDGRRASAALGTALKIVTAPITSLVTGFPAEFVPPVPVATDLAALFDEEITEHSVIYGAAGEPGLAVAIRTAALVRACDGVVATICRQVASMPA